MRAKECPECRWVPVVDGTGQRRLEMRWELTASASVTSASRAA
jgi:hypothetical protein